MWSWLRAVAGYKECGRIGSTRNNPRAYKEGKRIGGGGGGRGLIRS